MYSPARHTSIPPSRTARPSPKNPHAFGRVPVPETGTRPRVSRLRLAGRALGGKLVEPLALGPPNRRRPAELLEGPDDPGRDVELAAVDAMPRAGRVGVVAVVPRLS